MTPRITSERDNLSPALMQFLEQYGREKIDDNAPVSMQFAARDENGVLLGGVTGRLSHGILSVFLLALAPGARRSGLGSQLLRTIEDAARELGARVARLDTLEFEAPDFYQKQGYEIFGIVGDQIGRRQFFLFKRLVPVEADTH